MVDQHIVLVELIGHGPARRKRLTRIGRRIVWQRRRHVAQRAKVDWPAGDIQVGGADLAVALALLEMELALQQILERRWRARLDLEA